MTVIVHVIFLVWLAGISIFWFGVGVSAASGTVRYFKSVWGFGDRANRDCIVANVVYTPHWIGEGLIVPTRVVGGSERQRDLGSNPWNDPRYVPYVMRSNSGGQPGRRNREAMRVSM